MVWWHKTEVDTWGKLVLHFNIYDYNRSSTRELTFPGYLSSIMESKCVNVLNTVLVAFSNPGLLGPDSTLCLILGLWEALKCRAHLH